MDLERVVYKLEADITDLKQGLNSVQRDMRQTDAAFAQTQRTVDTTLAKTNTAISGASGASKALLAGWVGMQIGRFAKDVYQVGVEFNRVKDTLNNLTGSAAGTKEALGFVSGVADDLALDVDKLRANFVNLTAATKGTKLEGQATRDLFIGISEAGVALGRSTEEMSSTFDKFVRAGNNGRISLGELQAVTRELPGGFDAIAMAAYPAAGSVEDARNALVSLMEKGDIATQQIFPLISKAFHEHFAQGAKDAAQGAEEAITRFNNTWKGVKETLSEPMFTVMEASLKTLMPILVQTAEEIKDFTEAFNNIGKTTEASGLGTVATAIAEVAATMDTAFQSTQQMVNQKGTATGESIRTLITSVRDTYAEFTGWIDKSTESTGKLLEGTSLEADDINGVIDKAKAQVGGLVDQMVAADVTLMKLLDGSSPALIEGIRDAIASAESVITGFVNTIGDAVSSVDEAIRSTIAGFQVTESIGPIQDQMDQLETMKAGVASLQTELTRLSENFMPDSLETGAINKVKGAITELEAKITETNAKIDEMKQGLDALGGGSGSDLIAGAAGKDNLKPSVPLDPIKPAKAIKDNSEAIATLNRQRKESFADITRENAALVQLNVAYGNNDDAAVKLIETMAELDKLLVSLKIDPNSALAKSFKEAYVENVRLNKELQTTQERMEAIASHAQKMNDNLGAGEDEGRATRSRPDDVKTQTDTQESLKRSAKATWNFQEEIAKETLSDIRGMLVETFDSALTDASLSVSKFWGDFAAISQRVVSNVAANYVATLGQDLMSSTTTLSSALPSTFGSGTSLGSTFGGATVGGLATSGMLGMAGGGFAAQLTGGNAVGGQIGGGLGGMGGYLAGTALTPVLGPLAPVAGGILGSLLGGSLGGLFGGGSRRDNNFTGYFNAETGQYRDQTTNTNPDPANMQGVQSLGATLARLSAGLKGMGITSSGTFRLQSGSESGWRVGDEEFSSVSEAVAAGLKEVLSASQGMTLAQQTVMSKTQSKTAEALLYDLGVPEAIEAFITPVSAFGAAFKQLTTTFDTLLGDARRLGLNREGDRLETSYEEQSTTLRDAAKAALGIGQPESQYEQAIAAIRVQFDQARVDADLLQVSLGDLSKAENARIADVRAQEKTARIAARAQLGLDGNFDDPMAQSIAAVREQFRQARTQTDFLHTSVGQLNKVEAERIALIKSQYAEQRRTARISLTSSLDLKNLSVYAQGLASIHEQFRQGRIQARELGISIQSVNSAEKRRVADYKEEYRQSQIDRREGLISGFAGQVDSAFGFVDQLKSTRAEIGQQGGTASSRFEDAESAFSKIRKGVKAGDFGAFEMLPEASQTLLNAAREQYASGAKFQEIKAIVESTLDTAIKTAEDKRQQVMEGIYTNSTTLNGIVRDLLAENKSVRSELKEINRNLRLAA